MVLATCKIEHHSSVQIGCSTLIIGGIKYHGKFVDQCAMLCSLGPLILIFADNAAAGGEREGQARTKEKG